MSFGSRCEATQRKQGTSFFIGLRYWSSWPQQSAEVISPEFLGLTSIHANEATGGVRYAIDHEACVHQQYLVNGINLFAGTEYNKPTEVICMLMHRPAKRIGL